MDQIASFSDVVRWTSARTGGATGSATSRHPSEASILRDATAAVETFETEETSERVPARLCKSLGCRRRDGVRVVGRRR